MPWKSGGGINPFSIQGTADTYALLPNATTKDDQLWFVKSPKLFSLTPRGIYFATGGAWVQSTVSVKWSEDAGSVLNWTTWADWYDESEDISIGDRVLFNGKVYKNLTGTQIATSPLTDTTNWDNAFPQGIITVAKAGGDFTDPKEACDFITDSAIDNPYYIDVYPGEYFSDPFKIPDYTTMHLNNSRLCPNQTGNFIELGEVSAIRQGAILCATSTGATIYTNGSSGCVADRIRIENPDPPAGTGYLATGGGQLTILNCSVSKVTNGVFADGGALIISTIATSNCAIAMRVANGGFITGSVFGSFSGNALDIQQDDAISSIRFTPMLINIDKISIVNWALINITYTSDKEDDIALGVIQELHVGSAEKGYEICKGEGDSYTRGMLVYTEDTSNVFTDESDSARSASGSTLTYTGLTANNSIYIASSLSNGVDFLTHSGIKAKIQTACVSGSGEIALEYYNGSVWVEESASDYGADGQYLPNANNYFEIAESRQIRYNSELINDSWTKNDPMGIGTSYYWSRVQDKNSNNNDTVFQQIKLHTNHGEDNADGWPEYFGKARPQGQLGLNFSASKPFEGNMQSQQIYINENIGVGYTNNKFTLSSDKTGISGYLPFDFDTSSPIILQWAGRATVTQVIEWTIRVYWVTDNGTDTYYLTEPAIISGSKTVVVSKSITAGLVSMFEARIDVKEMISRRLGAFGDEITISMQPSTLSGTFSLTSSQAIYTKWCAGGHI